MDIKNIAETCSMFHRSVACGIELTASIIGTMENILGRKTTDEDKQLIMDNLHVIMTRYIATVASVVDIMKQSENVNISDISDMWIQRNITMIVLRVYVLLYDKHGHVPYTKEMLEELLSEIISKAKDIFTDMPMPSTIQ